LKELFSELVAASSWWKSYTLSRLKSCSLCKSLAVTKLWASRWDSYSRESFSVRQSPQIVGGRVAPCVAGRVVPFVPNDCTMDGESTSTILCLSILHLTIRSILSGDVLQSTIWCALLCRQYFVQTTIRTALPSDFTADYSTESWKSIAPMDMNQFASTRGSKFDRLND
jgi:hypothetical protein